MGGYFEIIDKWIRNFALFCLFLYTLVYIFSIFLMVLVNVPKIGQLQVALSFFGVMTII